MLRTVASVLLFVALAWANAGEERLIIQPERLDLCGADRQHGIVVTRVDAEGNATDVTADAKVTSSAPEIIQADKAQIVARADGAAEVLVSLGTISAKVPITVTGLNAQP